MGEQPRFTRREELLLLLARAGRSNAEMLQCLGIFERRQVLQERMAAAMAELDAAGRELERLQDGCVHQPELRFGGLCIACVRAREVLP